MGNDEEPGAGSRDGEPDWLTQLVMELCAGDILRRERVTWSVSLVDAIAWGQYNIRRRYEWLEILSRALGGGEAEGEAKKACADPQVCGMCRKRCGSRVAGTGQ